MPWPPKIGEPLPRAENAWCTRTKLIEWILAENGHGDQWGHVFHVKAKDAEIVWGSIAEAVLTAPVTELRKGDAFASYGVLVELTINTRTAPVLTAWHYGCRGDAPRLVTAYPKPYTRRNGDYG